MGRTKGSRNKPKAEKSILDDAVKIPYTRSASDDPIEQSMIDLMEIGRSVTKITTDGIRRLDPLSDEVAVAFHNATHKDQFTEVFDMKLDEVKKKFGDVKIAEPEPKFPKDWNTMGKVDRLRWLTENKR